MYAISTQRFSGDARGRVTTLHAGEVKMVNKDGRMAFEPVPGSEFELNADLVLLAMGFLGPERPGMLDALGVRMTERGTVWRDEQWMTSVPGVFTAGDMQRGQSLIVWAMADGRSCARRRHVLDGQLRAARAASLITKPRNHDHETTKARKHEITKKKGVFRVLAFSCFRACQG